MDGLRFASKQGLPKNINKHLILDLIRFTPGGISRAELARKMSLSRSAVTSIINDLMAAGVVRDSEALPSSGGRRPIMLEVNSNRGFVAGVDMGATHLALILADLSARVIHETGAAFNVSQGPQVCLEQVDVELHKLVDQAGLTLGDLMTVGVGVPGPVADDLGGVLNPPIMPGWHRYPIRAELQERWRLPVSLNNDAELGALGEWAYGAGRNESNVIYIKVGYGVGAGLVLNNTIYRGASGMAGEIGHLTMQNNGPLCLCGNRGCLEALASGRAIADQARQVVRSGQRTQLASLQPLETITARDVIQAARRGDLLAQYILIEAGSYLGTAIAGLINLLNPGIVVIGGGVAQAGDLILEPIRQAVQERGLKGANQEVRITGAVLGRRSSGIGAVVQAISMVLHRLADIPDE